MNRWNDIDTIEYFDMELKMYREPFVALTATTAHRDDFEFDHYAYLYLGSELLMYQILDTNFEQYMEERGDLSRMENILIPGNANLKDTVL